MEEKNGKKPLISVIVPVYNGEAYLENCMESIWNQTYAPLEIVVVDDGSIDNTPLLCQKLQEDYEHRQPNPGRSLQVLTLGDEGVSVARNRALSVIQGDYVCFVDADDRILPDMIAHLYHNLVTTESQVSGCGFFPWKREEEWETRLATTKFEDTITEQPRCYQGVEFQKQILKRNTRCWSKLYDAQMLRACQITFEEGLSIGEDMLFLATLTKQPIRFCESSYPGYGYYDNTQGAMQRKFTKKTMDQILSWEKAEAIMGKSAELEAIILISILLTMGRIAVLSREELKQYQEEIHDGHQKLKAYLSKGAFGQLSIGYRIKAILFRCCPKGYINLYHRWKRG